MVRWYNIITVRVYWADETEEVLKLIAHHPWKPNGRIVQLIPMSVEMEDIFDHKGEYANESKEE